MRLPPLHTFRTTDAPRDHMTTKHRTATATLCAAAFTFSLAGCEAQKSSNPLSPSVAGPIPGVNITAPKLVEPAQGFKYKESQQPIKLVIENATSNGVRPVSYMFEVATDVDFNSKVYARSGVPAGDNGRTSVQIDRLDLGRAYYWRAKADDGANASQFSASQFEVLPKPQLNAPGLVSPINNERVASRRPTLTVNNSDHNAAVASLNYEFQVATNQSFGTLVAGGMSDEGGGQTTFVSQADLASNVQHFWRVRSTDGETTSAWAPTQTFLTPAAPSPSPTPPPGPGNGGSCASNDGDAIIRCVGAAYPDKTAAGVSLDQRIANMEFIRDRVIEAGICGGLDLAWNKKRGTGPHSSDALVWRHNGIDDVVDIGSAYDDTSRPLGLQWAIVAGPPGYDPYPHPTCR
jgi:hypothetical protein